jgi:hypothetical protein
MAKFYFAATANWEIGIKHTKQTHKTPRKLQKEIEAKSVLSLFVLMPPSNSFIIDTTVISKLTKPLVRLKADWGLKNPRSALAAVNSWYKIFFLHKTPRTSQKAAGSILKLPVPFDTKSIQKFGHNSLKPNLLFNVL